MTSGVEDYDTEAYRHLQYSHAAVDFSPLNLLNYVHGPLMFKPGGPVPPRPGHHGPSLGDFFCSPEINPGGANQS